MPPPRTTPAPAAGEPISVACVEHVQLFKVKCSRQKEWHTECLSADLNTHPNRQFPGHFVDHMPCLRVLLRFTGLL